MRALIAILALLAPGLAHADRFDQPRFEVGIGGLMGEYLGDAHGGAVPRLLVGLNLGTVRVAGEYDFIDFITADQRDAQLHRVGATIRFTASTLSTFELTTGWYLEAGIGRELALWDAGGWSTRPDVALGAGWRFTGTLNHGHLVGFGLGLHVMVAPTLAPSGVARCAGCTAPSASRDTSISLAFEWMLH